MSAAIILIAAVIVACFLAAAWLLVAVTGLMERKDDGRYPHDL